MCFVWISEQTAIISLYNINWLVFVTQTESVYCAVRTGCLTERQADSSLQSNKWMQKVFNYSASLLIKALLK